MPPAAGGWLSQPVSRWSRPGTLTKAAVWSTGADENIDLADSCSRRLQRAVRRERLDGADELLPAVRKVGDPATLITTTLSLPCPGIGL